MTYDIVLSSQAPKVPDRPDVLGYLYNNGGLNNQKMAFVALLMSGLLGPKTVNIPYIYVKDQTTDLEYLARYQDVFDTEPLLDFASQHKIPVDMACPSGERGGWMYFRLFGTLLAESSSPPAIRATLLALTAMRPRVASTQVFEDLKKFLFASLGVETTIQLRIEHDWRYHAEEGLRSILGDTEDVNIGFVGILTKVKNTFPGLQLAYVTADEASMPVPKDEIRAFAHDRFGIRLIWKSDLIDTTRFNPLDLSLIDFEIAKYSPVFVGQSFSTFSNVLCLEKFALQRAPVTGHFIYNHLGDTVRQRRDNGFMGTSTRVVVPNASDSLWSGDHA
jgi:hypothetical protein